jgi:hypothetical protein
VYDGRVVQAEPAQPDHHTLLFFIDAVATANAFFASFDYAQGRLRQGRKLLFCSGFGRLRPKPEQRTSFSTLPQAGKAIAA